MFTRLYPILCGAAALLSALSATQAQVSPAAPLSNSLEPVALAPASAPVAAPAPDTTKPANSAPSTVTMGDGQAMLLVQAATPPAAPATTTTTTTTQSSLPESAPVIDSNGVGVREFQGDEVGQVLRLLARQAKVNMVVSEAVAGTVTMRLEDVTAMQAVEIIAKSKSLFVDKIDGVYYIKTAAERTAEPTESDSYQFSYGRAKDMAPLVAAQLASKDAPQVDERTNTLFYRETRSNVDSIRKLLVQIDKPTKQVMIEARLVEVTANPQQNYGINWAGALKNKSVGYGPNTGGDFELPSSNSDLIGNFGKLALGSFAILSVPQMSVTLNALNEDSDAEFLANPRVVTADNQQATIEITTSQPVPQLNFNEQTATAVFGGFLDKKYGNKLVVRPSVNKDNFVTLAVKPEISNKVRDETFTFSGADRAEPGYRHPHSGLKRPDQERRYPRDRWPSAG